MGYACPVCETPQADAVHLANHLAFTALARGGDHEAWLDERVPGWGDLGEAALAERVVEDAEEADYPQVFEDTTGESAADGHERGEPTGDRRFPAAPRDGDADVEAILEEARELTRRRREESETE